MRVVTAPRIGARHLRTTEVLVRGWDLACATGQDVSFPDDIVRQELEFTPATRSQIPPNWKPFGPPGQRLTMRRRSTGWRPSSAGLSQPPRIPRDQWREVHHPPRMFAESVVPFSGESEVTSPAEPGRHGLGSSALMVNGSILAVLTRGDLVLRLPGARVAALTEAGPCFPLGAPKRAPM